MTLNIERTVQKIETTKKNMHDRLIYQMIQRLQDSPVFYDSLGIHKEYGPWFQRRGEIDVYAIKGNRMLIFEMKSIDSHHCYLKALNQLRKANRYYKQYRITGFYVTPNRGKRLI